MATTLATKLRMVMYQATHTDLRLATHTNRPWPCVILDWDGAERYVDMSQDEMQYEATLIENGAYDFDAYDDIVFV